MERRIKVKVASLNLFYMRSELQLQFGLGNRKKRVRKMQNTGKNTIDDI